MAGIFDSAIQCRRRLSAVVPDSNSAATVRFESNVQSDPYTRYVRLSWIDVVEFAHDAPFYIYGAGSHTEWLLSVVADLRKPDIRCIFDDHPLRQWLAGHPVRATGDVSLQCGAVVLLSSDRLESQLAARSRELFGQRAKIVRLYDGLPPGPYPKPETPDQIRRRRDAVRRARIRWGGADFVGPYEHAGYVTGFLHEQWLWSHRRNIRGSVLDMSTPRHWHDWVYNLSDVDGVLVSDLDKDVITKLGHSTRVNIHADFCSDAIPIADDSLDTIICASILEHCRRPQEMLVNLNWLLAPGGTLLLNVPFVCPDGHDRPDYWRFGRDALAMMARQAGFSDVSTFALGDAAEILGDLLGHVHGNNDENTLPLLTALVAVKSK